MRFALVAAFFGSVSSRTPSTYFAAAAFSSMAICLCSFVRKREDFDMVMGLLVMPMFLFSGIFFPVTQMPAFLQVIVQAVPLYHAVALLRALTTGALSVAIVWHIAYLFVGGAVAFLVAMRRLERTLIK